MRRAVIVVLLVLSVACGGTAPTAPTGTNPTAVIASPAPPPTTNFPPLSGPSRTFVFDRELSYQVHDYTKQSRFILYDNGAFVLQFANSGNGYRGEYTEASGPIEFKWEGWSAAGAWGAIGTLKNGLLTVQYNFIMQLTDFEDAVYVLMP